MTSFALYSWKGRYHSRSEAIIVIVSALGQEALVLEAAKKGAKDFIQKPFKADQIEDVLERVAGK